MGAQMWLPDNGSRSTNAVRYHSGCSVALHPEIPVASSPRGTDAHYFHPLGSPTKVRSCFRVATRPSGNKSKARRLGDHLSDNATYNVRASKVAFHETNGGDRRRGTTRYHAVASTRTDYLVRSRSGKTAQTAAVCRGSNSSCFSSPRKYSKAALV